MRIKEIVEAAMSVGIQGRQPVSAGARGLMAARWKYETVIDHSNVTNMQNAVERLASKLDEIEKIDYASIDELMRGISVDFHIDPKDLHNAFIAKYKLTPDAMAAKMKHERKNRPKSV
jgi:ribosomal protein S18